MTKSDTRSKKTTHSTYGNRIYLILGAEGQLGEAVSNALAQPGVDRVVIPEGHQHVDVTRSQTLLEALEGHRPGVVINCAAYTNVSQAETDRRRCWGVNTLGTAVVADLCRRWGIPLIQLSSDFVFGGDGRDALVPYNEYDVMCPVNHYGKTKALGEYEVLRNAVEYPEWRYYIVRTAGLFSKRRENNFPTKIREQLLMGNTPRVVNDVVTNITYADDLAQAIAWIATNVSSVPPGIYHITNGGYATWHNVAWAVCQGLKSSVHPDSSTRDIYVRLKGRDPSLVPKYTVLDTRKYHQLGAPEMPPWEDAIRRWCERQAIGTRWRAVMLTGPDPVLGEFEGPADPAEAMAVAGQRYQLDDETQFRIEPVYEQEIHDQRYYPESGPVLGEQDLH